MKNILIKALQFRKSDLIKGSFWLTAGGLVASAANYVFHLVMGRLLLPEEYGTLSALMTLTIIISLPSTIIITVTTKFVAEYISKKEIKKLIRFASRMTYYAALMSLAVLVIFVLFNSGIQSYLNVHNAGYITITGFIIVVGFISSIQQGMYRGLLLFKEMTWFQLFGVVLKLALGWYFVTIGYGLLGVLWALFISAFLQWFISLIPIRNYFSLATEKVAGMKQHVLSFSVPTFLMTISTTLLVSADIVLVKHFFTSEQAGIYAAASLVGKSIYYALVPISIVLFSVIVKNYSAGKSVRKEVLLSTFLTAVPGVIAVSIFYLAPQFILSIFFPSAQYQEAANYIVLYGLFMFFFALVFMFSNIFLAIKHTVFLGYLLAGALLQIILISLFHANLEEVIIISVSVTGLLLLVSIAELFRLKLLR